VPRTLDRQEFLPLPDSARRLVRLALGCARPLGDCRLGLQLLQCKLQLLDLLGDALGGSAELHAPQLRDQQGQRFDVNAEVILTRFAAGSPK
jgi:hypothetical protein